MTPSSAGWSTSGPDDSGSSSGTGAARILERGYRSYDGPRLGARGAMRSLVRHSVQRVLGLKRTFWNKILPFGAIFIAYVPAIAFVGIAALLKDRFERTGVDINQVIPSYAEFYLFVWAAILVFAALPASLSLAIASTTTRRAAASAAFILVTIGSAVVAETLVNSGASPALFVIDLPYLPLELVGRLYGERAGFLAASSTNTSTATMVIAYLAITLGCAVFVRFRYQTIRVSR